MAPEVRTAGLMNILSTVISCKVSQTYQRLRYFNYLLKNSGYGRRCKALEAAIRARFAYNLSQLTFVSKKTGLLPTGYFEVSVNDVLIHSKKRGDGYCDTQDKIGRVFKAIEDALGAERQPS